MVKRFHVLIVICSLALSGCWDRIEVNDVLIVTAAAIDKAENKEIELSIQVFIPRTLGGVGAMQGGGLKSMTLVQSARGENIADAMSKIQRKISRIIFWGHCEAYIYGEELAKEGIMGLVDYFARHPEPRNRAYMYVSKGKAADILKVTPELERYSAEVVHKLSGQHIGMEVSFVELLQMLMSSSKAAVLPLIAQLPIQETAASDVTIPYLFGSAVLKDGKMIGQLTERATRGVMWLRDEIAETTVTVKAKKVKGFASFHPIRATTELVPVIEQGKWKMIVNMETEGDLIQNGTNLNLVNNDLMHIMQEALRKDIETRIRAALRQVQQGMKADIFGFATQFHRRYPKEFAKVKDRWEEVFPTIEVRTDVSAYIRRPGLTTIPAGLVESEVREK